MTALRQWADGVTRPTYGCCSGDPVATEKDAQRHFQEREMSQAHTMWFTRSRLSRRILPVTVGVLLFLSSPRARPASILLRRRGTRPRVRKTLPTTAASPSPASNTRPRQAATGTGLPSWAHGYPLSEDNLMRIMNEISYLGAHVDGYQRLRARRSPSCPGIRSPTSPKQAGGR